MTDYSYVVTYKPEGVATDITDFVERIDAVEIGSGEVRNLKLRLNATDAAFITNPDFTGTGNTPLIDQFDKIRLQITDRDFNVYDVTYEVDNSKPVQNAQVGLVFEVEALGQEHWLQKIMFVKPFFQESGFTVARDIVDIFNNDPDARGSDQAIVIDQSDTFADGGGNDLPLTTANVYPFIVSEQTTYDGLIIMIDRMGSSVSAGGAGDFFELGFEDDLTDPAFRTLKFRGFSSGNPPDQNSIPTIDDSVSINPGEEEGGLQAQEGSVLGSWGADNIGKLPRQNARFQGALEIWNVFPEHTSALVPPLSGIEWSEDSIVEDRDSQERNQGDFFHYKANKDTTLNPPTPPTNSNADWDLHTFVDFLATEVSTAGQYSLWTNNRANEWRSCMANTENQTEQDDPPTFDSIACWDHNQVIVDGSFSQTWADVRALNVAGIPNQFKYPNGIGIQRAFRVLVDGTGTDEFAGLDNQIIQWDGSKWLTFRDPADDALCAVDFDGKVFQKQSGLWVDVSSENQFNHCYHPIFDITNVQGVNQKDNGAGSNFGLVSAVQTENRYDRGDLTAFNLARFYRQGIWLNFRFPFPPNNYNGNTKGELYGKDNGDYEPATLDGGNMHLTSSGLSGFNNIEAEDLGPLYALEFVNNFQWRFQNDGSGELVQAGNFACRCVVYDSSDNVVIQDFVIPFNGDYNQTVSLPLSAFKIYRGRKPWSVANVQSNVFVQELEILNVFEWKNIIKIGLVWLGPYDDEGRYQPWGQIGFIFPSIIDAGNQLFSDGFNIKWAVDAFQFAKPGLSVSPPIATRTIMPRFVDENQINNMFSLQQANLANLEIVQFRHVDYEIVTEGFIGDRDTGIRFGDSFFLENADLVREANKNESSPGANDGIPNTIKLVAKSIRYEITKSGHGPGGFLRYITGVKRFV